MPIVRTIGDKSNVCMWTDNTEAEADQQLMNASRLPFVIRMCAMPDCHSGYGVPVGTVVKCKGAIAPAFVGVDIGCGMAAMQVDIDPDKVIAEADVLRHSIERSIPLGRNQHKEAVGATDILGLTLPRCAKEAGITQDKVDHQLGTLGGGNHFIEVCLDEDRKVWVMLHSGSRNSGLRVANYYIDVAKKLMSRYFITLPDPYLAYLVEGTQEFENYWNDLAWAQGYALLNRTAMLTLIMKDIRHFAGQSALMFDSTILCHHNYAVKEGEYMIVRKGAISAKQGEMGIIPGSMGAKSYIVEGLGNPASFMSSSHGAGRKMSRTKAKQVFTQEDLTKSMAGISYGGSAKVLDEIAGAYKDIDEVMANQEDLTRKVHTLKQVISIKGSD